MTSRAAMLVQLAKKFNTGTTDPTVIQPKYSNMLLVTENMDMDINSTEPSTTDQPTVPVPQLDEEEIHSGAIGMETLQQNEDSGDEERINSTEPPIVPVPQLVEEEIHLGDIGMETLEQNEDPEDAERMVELNSSDVNISIPSELLDISNINDFILLDTAETIDEQVKIIDEDERLVGDGGLKENRVKSVRRQKKEETMHGRNKKMKPNPCAEGKCKLGCFLIQEDKRHDIFKNYWNMNSYEEKKNWILSCVENGVVKRRRTVGESRRSKTCSYFLVLDGRKTQVCLQFLLKTLDISHRAISYTKENSSKTNTCKADRRGRHCPANKTSEEKSGAVRNFIKRLPAVPSHYCRRDSKKKYLDSELQNLSNVYRIYKSSVSSDLLVNERVFRNIFNREFDLRFHVPKKDKCALCEKFKLKSIENLSEEEVQEKETHLKLKEAAKNKFDEAHKRALADRSYLCVSFDLQKVLNTPKGESMLLYYSRKYAVYNLSVYESITKEGYCYIWGEADGHRGANEICSIITKYLEVVDKRELIKEVALFCDSCPGQNKNKQMIACIYEFIQSCQNIREITITYLLPGHTYMTVDSIHATIENFTKKRHIWAPSEWPTLISNSRLKPKPYNVEVLKHTDFLDHKSSSARYNLEKKGEKLNISSVRICQFKKGEENVYLKNSFDEDEETRKISMLCKRSKTEVTSKTRLYNDKLPINERKYKNLIDLCKNGIIPERFHTEYFQMPHNKKTADILPETDEEDSVDV